MKIFVVNASTLLSPADFTKMVAAVAKQVARDFCPAWNMVPVTVTAGSMPSNSPNDSGMVAIYDTPDADALGYHTEANDRPFGKVFVKPVLDSKGVMLKDPKNIKTPSVASVLSHEVLELIADPSVNLWAEGPESAYGSEYSYEVCDPVEADQYEIDGVAVSNFVLPSWFDPQTHSGEKYDWLGLLKRPFTMTSGGYMVVRKRPGAEKSIFARSKRTVRQKIREGHGLGRGAHRKQRTKKPKKPKKAKR